METIFKHKMKIHEAYISGAISKEAYEKFYDLVDSGRFYNFYQDRSIKLVNDYIEKRNGMGLISSKYGTLFTPQKMSKFNEWTVLRNLAYHLSELVDYDNQGNFRKPVSLPQVLGYSPNSYAQIPYLKLKEDFSRSVQGEYAFDVDISRVPSSLTYIEREEILRLILDYINSVERTGVNPELCRNKTYFEDMLSRIENLRLAITNQHI